MLVEPHIALLADIHGNALALEAVLADARKRNVRSFIVAGDLVMNGPKPAEALLLIRELDAPTLLGNTDLEVVVGTDPVASWTRWQVGEAGVEYLRALPTKYRVTLSGGRTPFDELLVVHASPRSCNDLLVLEPHPLETTFTRPTPIGDAEAMLDGESADLIVFGHIHYASSGTVRGQRLAFIGSVGFPFDGDPRAAYALASWDGQGWRVEHCRVAYDHEAVASDMESSGLPFATRYARMIREANWFPHEAVR